MGRSRVSNEDTALTDFFALNFGSHYQGQFLVNMCTPS